MGVGPSTCRCRDMMSVQVQVVASADRKFVLNETYMAGLKQLCCLQICLMQPRQGTVSSTSNLYYTGVHGGF